MMTLNRCALLCIATLSSACGAVGVCAVDVEHGMAALPPPPPPQTTPQGDISVVLNVSRDLGCVPEGPTLRRCDSSHGSAPTVDTMKEVARVEGRKNVYMMEGFGSSLADRLEAHLERHFETASVTLQDDAAGQGAAAGIDAQFVLQMGTYAWSDQRLQVVLSPTDGADVDGAGGSKFPTGHLVWMFPTMVLTFPIGTVLVGGIMEDMAFNTMAYGMARAIDDASIQMAERLHQDQATGSTLTTTVE